MITKIISYCSTTGESQGKLIRAITNAPIWQKNPKTTRGLRPIKRLRYVPKIPNAKPPMISPTPTTTYLKIETFFIKRIFCYFFQITHFTYQYHVNQLNFWNLRSCSDQCRCHIPQTKMLKPNQYRQK